MERSEAFNQSLSLGKLLMEWSFVRNAIKYAMKNHELRNYSDNLITTSDLLMILYTISQNLDLSDFHLGHLVYPCLVTIYQLLSNSYLYYLFCFIIFSLSYIVLEIKNLAYCQEPFSLFSFILLILYLIAFPTFSTYSSVPSGLIPIIYFSVLYNKYYSEDFKMIFQILWTTSVFVLVTYCSIRQINQERFFVFMIEVCTVLAVLLAYIFILPETLSNLYNNRPQRKNIEDKNSIQYTDIEISICLFGAFLSLFLAESILELIYSRVPVMYYLMIAYGYSSILEIAYSLYHKTPYVHQEKYLISFMAQLVFMKSAWVCFISPYLF